MLPGHGPLQGHRDPQLGRVLHKHVPLVFLRRGLTVLPEQLHRLVHLFKGGFQLRRVLPLQQALPHRRKAVAHFIVEPGLERHDLLFPGHLLHILRQPAQLPVHPQQLLILPQQLLPLALQVCHLRKDALHMGAAPLPEHGLLRVEPAGAVRQHKGRIFAVHPSAMGGGPHLLVQLFQRLQIPAGEGTVDPEHLPVAQPDDAVRGKVAHRRGQVVKALLDGAAGDVVRVQPLLQFVPHSGAPPSK